MEVQLREAITSFVDLIAEEINAHQLEEILDGELIPTGRDLGGYEPEAYIEDELIYPILEGALGLSKRRFPYSNDRTPRRPDFEILELEIVGENKVLNDYDSAFSDLKDRYLRDKGVEEDFGIATDGFKWELIRIDTGGDFRQIDHVAEGNLRPVAQEYAVSKGLIGGEPPDVDTDELLSDFASDFSRDGLEHHLDVAPQRFRDLLKGSIDEFYELYVELLFGKGSTHDYDTTLLSDIQSPHDATKIEERIFAITVVNRLLFIKLLEEGNVLPNGFLADRVEEYNQSRRKLAGLSLYENQIKPIFYDLFNTPRDERKSKHCRQSSWFAEVPYLNGGLFRENIEDEKEYGIKDRILPQLIYDLIEGHKLEREGGLDPAILGNVFEMTINYISGEEGRQEDIGAYYTPNDASRLVTEGTVDKAIRDTLVDVYSQYYPEIESREGEFPLSKMLRWIADQRSWFSDPEATEEAYKRIGELKVLDPACGSGHFLTSAVTAIHQARMALMQGMGWEERDDWDKCVYKAKEEVVTNAIYGVDVDPVAVEIAKLRVWLKIIEEGWEEEFGRLPNIDLNILDGNSLVGLPAKEQRGVTLDLFQNRVDRIEELRSEYKHENENVKGEISDRTEELEEELNKEYLRKIDEKYAIEVKVYSFDDLKKEPLYVNKENVEDVVSSLTFRKPDTVDEISDEERDWLDSRGFRANPAWGTTARLDIEGNSAVSANLVETIEKAFERGFHISKVERYPVISDIESAEGNVFHWGANFPEALDANGKGGFDIVIGNPPYGRDVLSLPEKVLTNGYETANVNDIVAPFVERELQLLRNGGYFGNVVTLKLAYQGQTGSVRNILKRQLDDAKLACFARRPDQVFKGTQVRTGFLTGRKENEDADHGLKTSEFLRFFDDKERREREEAFSNISFQDTRGLWLGDRIGTGNKALPKIGSERIQTIIKKLRDQTDSVFNDVMSRSPSGDYDYKMWRREGTSYFINPLIENLYPSGEKPREVKPMYFKTKLKRNCAFLSLQTSLYYLFWMVYGNERHLPWKIIEAFPFPSDQQLIENDNRINNIADILWQEMKDRFKGGSREVIRKSPVLKPIMDEADNLVDPMYGLNEDEIEFVKQYQESYRLSRLDDPSSEQVTLKLLEGYG